VRIMDHFLSVFLISVIYLHAIMLSLNLECVDGFITYNSRSVERRTTLVRIGQEPLPEPLRLITVDGKRNDNALERMAIHYLSSFIATICPDKLAANELVKPGMTYQNFVTLTKLLLRFGTADEIRFKITSLLKSILPQAIRNQIRVLSFVNTKWISEKSSLWMKLGLLSWLVGPVQRFHIPTQKLTVANPGNDDWHSGVKLEKCRYLDEAKCKSACLHLCKAPTQDFFNNELGLPLYMKPNFEDCSCEMFFGVSPPAIKDDPAYKEPCYVACPAVHKRVRDGATGEKVSLQHPLLQGQFEE